MEELKPLEESLDDLKDELCKYAKEIYLTAYEDGAQAREFFEDGLNAEFAERIGSIVDDWNRRTAPENVRNLLDTIHDLRNENNRLRTGIERTKTAAPNKPLTLEQLREMKGQPVYCIGQTRFDVHFDGWKVVAKNNLTANVIRFTDGMDFPVEVYGERLLAYARKPEESNPLMNELREKLNQLEAEVTAESGDAAETYTNGYIWGHRNGQIELLRRILKTDEGGTIKPEGSEKP